MVFWAVHMAEGHCHHLLQNLQRILRGLVKTKLIYGIYTLCVALVTDIMALLAASITLLSLMAYRTLHKNFIFKILKRSTTY